MDVIFTTTEREWFRWSKQYVKRQSTLRRSVEIAPNTGGRVAKDKIINAINMAGPGGRLIISVGHGKSLDNQPADGLCELAPGGMLVLVSHEVRPAKPRPGATIIDVFYDTRFGGQPSDLENDTKNHPDSQNLKDWILYQEIGSAMRRIRPFRVVFLTCRIGNATEFLRKIANDWGVVINAYTKKVACTEDEFSQPGKRTIITSYVYLEGENFPISAPGGAEANVIASEELPYRPGNSVSIGPPLPKP